MGKAARLKQQRREARAAASPPRSGPSRVVVAAVAVLGVAAFALAAAFIAFGRDDHAPLAARAPVTPAAPPPPAREAAEGTPGLQTGPAPWFAEQEQLATRLESIGIPFSKMEGTAVHIHPTLRVVVNGKPLTVPTDIGISYAEQAMAALHTHDEEGTIHVESPVVRDYTLGQFFDTWGVRLTERCVGGYCAGNGKQLRAFVDGNAVTNPRAITFADE
jgi:hypothetical protein